MLKGLKAANNLLIQRLGVQAINLDLPVATRQHADLAGTCYIVPADTNTEVLLDTFNVLPQDNCYNYAHYTNYGKLILNENTAPVLAITPQAIRELLLNDVTHTVGLNFDTLTSLYNHTLKTKDAFYRPYYNVVFNFVDDTNYCKLIASDNHRLLNITIACDEFNSAPAAYPVPNIFIKAVADYLKANKLKQPATFKFNALINYAIAIIDLPDKTQTVFAFKLSSVSYPDAFKVLNDFFNLKNFTKAFNIHLNKATVKALIDAIKAIKPKRQDIPKDLSPAVIINLTDMQPVTVSNKYVPGVDVTVPGTIMTAPIEDAYQRYEKFTVNPDYLLDALNAVASYNDVVVNILPHNNALTIQAKTGSIRIIVLGIRE